MPTLCICGIDTGIGKSLVTGLLARHLMGQGSRVITQKLVQTGCNGRSTDILIHRRLMETGWLEVDEEQLTCPYCFPFAASPHLAARLAGRAIDPARITAATRRLEARFEWTLLEGAGGLLVPLTEELTLLDYLADQDVPVILVTSPRLGSINHTLMSLEMLRTRRMKLAGLVYNLFGQDQKAIVMDSRQVFARALREYGFQASIVDLPIWPQGGRAEWPGVLTFFR